MVIPTFVQSPEKFYVDVFFSVPAEAWGILTAEASTNLIGIAFPVFLLFQTTVGNPILLNMYSFSYAKTSIFAARCEDERS